jgi:hypothetical protein
VSDSLLRGEAPIASHLLYTQPGVLNDQVADERRLGIEAGLAWLRAAKATVVYQDLGISPEWTTESRPPRRRGSRLSTGPLARGSQC